MTTSTSPRIRRGTVADLAVICRHRRRMFEDMGHSDAPMLRAAEPLYTRWLEERLTNDRYRAWLAVDDAGNVLAGAGLWLMDWPPGVLDAAPFRGYVFNVFTEPQHRRQGLAGRLVRAILDHCADEGIQVIGLHASAHGRSVYEALGFKPTNEMRYIRP